MTSRELLEAALEELVDSQDPLESDPLLQFVEDFEGGRSRAVGETVNLSNLFGVAKALQDARWLGDARERLRSRQANADILAPVIEQVGWDVRVPEDRLRSGVMLITPRVRVPRHIYQGDTLRHRASSLGIAFSSYSGGLIRLSMPDRPFTANELGYVEGVFKRLI